MSKLKLIVNFTLTMLFIALSVSLVAAQDKKDKGKGKEQVAIDPRDKPINVKVEVKQAYKRWLDNDVAYIITKDEKRTIAEMMAKGSYASFVLATSDVDGVFEQVQSTGAEVAQEPIDQPYGVRDCAFRDPAGNMVRIQQPSR